MTVQCMPPLWVRPPSPTIALWARPTSSWHPMLFIHYHWDPKTWAGNGCGINDAIALCLSRRLTASPYLPTIGCEHGGGGGRARSLYAIPPSPPPPPPPGFER